MLLSKKENIPLSMLIICEFTTQDQVECVLFNLRIICK